jgi:hypothetical protein
VSWRGVFAGVLGLVALEAILRTEASAGRFGAMVASLGNVARYAMSPMVPAIPDRSEAGLDSPLNPF